MLSLSLLSSVSKSLDLWCSTHLWPASNYRINIPFITSLTVERLIIRCDFLFQQLHQIEMTSILNKHRNAALSSKTRKIQIMLCQWIKYFVWWAAINLKRVKFQLNGILESRIKQSEVPEEAARIKCERKLDIPEYFHALLLRPWFYKSFFFGISFFNFTIAHKDLLIWANKTSRLISVSLASALENQLK